MASRKRHNTSDACAHDRYAYSFPSQAVLSREEETAVLQRIERGIAAIDRLMELLMPHLERTVRERPPDSVSTETVFAAAQSGLHEVLFGLGTDGAVVIGEPREMLRHPHTTAAESNSPGEEAHRLSF